MTIAFLFILSYRLIAMILKLKRIYDNAAEDDGYRVLVDRLWPRGIKKESAKVDLWEKNLAPTTELRKWFNHDLEKWDEFYRRYSEELAKNESYDSFMDSISSYPVVTLLFAAKDTAHNNAVVLRDVINKG